jgi:hypothetical protein
MHKPSAASSPRPDFSQQQSNKGEFRCSNFISTARRTPTRSRCFWKKSGLPYELVPVDTRKGDQFKPEFLGQSERQGAGDRR